MFLFECTLLSSSDQLNSEYFFPDCQFDASGVVLSTSPLAPPTHWKQTVIVTASTFENKSDGGAKSEENVNLVEEDDIIGWELVLNRYVPWLT